MNWNKEPKVSGWYWIKGLDTKEPWFVSHHRHKDEWWIMDTEVGSDTLITENLNLQFYGPLEFPE